MQGSCLLRSLIQLLLLLLLPLLLAGMSAEGPATPCALRMEVLCAAAAAITSADVTLTFGSVGAGRLMHVGDFGAGYNGSVLLQPSCGVCLQHPSSTATGE